MQPLPGENLRKKSQASKRPTQPPRVPSAFDGFKFVYARSGRHHAEIRGSEYVPYCWVKLSVSAVWNSLTRRVIRGNDPTLTFLADSTKNQNDGFKHKDVFNHIMNSPLPTAGRV